MSFFNESLKFSKTTRLLDIDTRFDGGAPEKGKYGHEYTSVETIIENYTGREIIVVGTDGLPRLYGRGRVPSQDIFKNKVVIRYRYHFNIETDIHYSPNTTLDPTLIFSSQNNYLASQATVSSIDNSSNTSDMYFGGGPVSNVNTTKKNTNEVLTIITTKKTVNGRLVSKVRKIISKDESSALRDNTDFKLSNSYDMVYTIDLEELIDNTHGVCSNETKLAFFIKDYVDSRDDVRLYNPWQEGIEALNFSSNIAFNEEFKSKEHNASIFYQLVDNEGEIGKLFTKLNGCVQEILPTLNKGKESGLYIWKTNSKGYYSESGINNTEFEILNKEKIFELKDEVSGEKVFFKSKADLERGSKNRDEELLEAKREFEALKEASEKQKQEHERIKNEEQFRAWKARAEHDRKKQEFENHALNKSSNWLKVLGDVLKNAAIFIGAAVSLYMAYKTKTVPK